MSWFYERRVIPSEKNGRIEARRFFGRWEAVVKQTHESTRYLTAMWVEAFERIPVWLPVKSVLLLGLGLGDTLRTLERRFPGCKVTAVEWDPAMVSLFEEVGPKNVSRPTVITDDAGEAVMNLEAAYDLIILDLFTGPEIGAPVRRPEFHARLARLLKPTGMIVANFYANPELAAMLVPHFDGIDIWKWDFNSLAIAQAKLPTGYIPYRGDSAFIARECAEDSSRVAVGHPPTGTAWGFWPLRFERHESDIEPQAPKTGPLRSVYWQRTMRRDVPSGWRKASVAQPTRLTGFADISLNKTGDWSSHARRHLARWRKQREFILQEIPLESFIAQYRVSRLPRILKHLYAVSLCQKQRAHGALLTCYGVIRKDGAVRGGFVSLGLPEGSGALHFASFVHPDAEKASAMYGLIDRWFEDGRAHGLRFMDFDGFWAPGDPPSWKGYSRFKAQFGVTFVRRPALLTRSAGNWRETFRETENTL